VGQLPEAKNVYPNMTHEQHIRTSYILITITCLDVTFKMEAES